MNKVFVAGIVMKNVDFKFFLHGKNASIAKFNIEVEKKQIIKVVAYNEVADICYRNLKQNDNVMIYGILNQNYEVILKRFYIFYKNTKGKKKNEKGKKTKQKA